jgi:hypothetical protein
MRRTLLVPFVAALVGAGSAAASSPHDVLKSANHLMPLAVGTTYRPSLFSPSMIITPSSAYWTAAQFVNKGYPTLALVHADGSSPGGMVVLAAPSPGPTASQTLRLLRTERAAGTMVGISTSATVRVTVGGLLGWQFDGTVVGQYGHTFVPFSGHSRAASESIGDHVRLPRNDAFRIIVLPVRGRTVVFIIDSDASQIDLNFQADALKLLSLLRFPAS